MSEKNKISIVTTETYDNECLLRLGKVNSRGEEEQLIITKMEIKEFPGPFPYKSYLIDMGTLKKCVDELTFNEDMKDD